MEIFPKSDFNSRCLFSCVLVSPFEICGIPFLKFWYAFTMNISARFYIISTIIFWWTPSAKRSTAKLSNFLFLVGFMRIRKPQHIHYLFLSAYFSVSSPCTIAAIVQYSTPNGCSQEHPPLRTSHYDPHYPKKRRQHHPQRCIHH